jgi:hypothetical protein
VVGRIAEIASILSLAVSAKVLYDVMKLRHIYLFKARVPELTDKLSAQASKISEFLNAFSSSGDQIAVELAHTEVLLGSLSGKASGNIKSSGRSVLKLVKSYSKTADQDSLRKIYVELRKLDALVRDTLEDLQWDK